MTDILEGAQGADDGEPAGVVKEHAHGGARPFLRGLFFAVVTLSFYHFWWHWNTHKEAVRQLGRPDPWRWVWAGYIAALVANAAYGFAFVFPLDPPRGPPDGTLARLRWLHENGHPIGLPILFEALIVFFFLTFVVRQYQVLRTLRQTVPELRAGTQSIVWGVGLFAAFEVIRFGPPLMALVFGIPVALLAYAALQLSYNELWGAIKGATLTQGTALPVGVTSSGREVIEVQYACPSCRTMNSAVGEAGHEVPTRCGSCGRQGTVMAEPPRPDPEDHAAALPA